MGNTRGLLLLAHGSELPRARQELEQLAARLAARTTADVTAIGFLSLATPSIPEAVARLAQFGVTDALAVPCFLTSGYLMKKAVQLAEKEADKHPPLSLQVAPPLGRHPLLAEIVLQRIREV